MEVIDQVIDCEMLKCSKQLYDNWMENCHYLFLVLLRRRYKKRTEMVMAEALGFLITDVKIYLLTHSNACRASVPTDQLTIW